MNYLQMGHLALEPECHVKGHILDGRPRHAKEVLLTAGWFRTAINRHLLNYWKAHFIVLNSKVLYFLYRVVRSDAIVIDIRLLGDPSDDTERFYSVIPKWKDRPSLCQLSAEDQQWGWRQLKQYGISEEDWFVCIHCREDRYSPNAEHLHRNADIATYDQAVAAILDRGGWCIRVGESSTKVSESSHSKIIDYAHSRLKSDRMDVFLCAACRFFLGNTSGLFCLASLFGRPCAQAHMIPMACLPLTEKDLSIFKLLRSRETRSILTFQQVFDSPIANYQRTQPYKEQGIEWIDNTSEDIYELTCEMLDILDEKVDYIEADSERQRRFWKLVSKGHLGHGGAGRIGRSFLKRHEVLLP